MQGRVFVFRIVFCVFLACLGWIKPVYAQADILTPELTSRIHCILLLNSLDPYAASPGILQKRMETFFTQRSEATDRLFGYLGRTEWLPDFGFIIGSRWDSMTLAERNRFNRAFVLFLGKHYGLKDYTGSDCSLHTTIQGAGEEKDPESPSISMRAIAYTHLVSQTNRIALIYSYNFLPETGWVLSDIALQDRSLVETYRGPINTWIQQKGIFNLELTLESLTEK
jgi:hypothetical protein